MRGEEEEVDFNMFSKWEQELPSPEELIPLSQSLITPHLAVAFDLQPPPPPPPPPRDDEESAKALKRPRLVWTPQLHKRFVDAVAHIGIKNAVPKTIMQLMCVDGLTRENVASHLQKYRLYLNRTKSSSGGGAGGGGGGGRGDGGGGGGFDHMLFSASSVPTHFFDPTYMPSFVSFPTLNHHHRQQPPVPHAVEFTSPVSNGKVMEQSLFLARQSQHQVLRTEDKTELTLFPTRED